MEPKVYYKHRIEEFQKRQKRLGKLRNWITFGKLSAFIGIGVCVYGFAVSGDRDILVGAVVCLLGFAFLSVRDAAVVLQTKRCKAVIKEGEIELRYLTGDLSGLIPGSGYGEEGHPYAADLDIVGENSLFQHMNRTVTLGGRDKLAEWLLRPCKESREIEERQQAAGELAGRPDWCGDFRLKGEVYASNSDKPVDFQSWLGAPPYFRKKAVWVGIYTANVLTLILWLCTLFAGTFYIYALFASFLQVVWVLTHLKRMNAYNERLDGFLRTVKVYLHLIRHLENTAFESRRLEALKEQLSGEKCPATKAFTALKRNLNRFEQRGNFLVSILLNGLYTDTFYAVKGLECWRLTYGRPVMAWLEAIHETDVLVSMAVYRFNHPEYTVPLCKEGRWLKAEGAGHPLLGTDGGIRNDFSVNAVHEFLIITGANMAGKSTFLRTVGINLLLALTGNVVCSRLFEFSIMDLFTSMRTTDNLAKGTSYFHAELLRLKQLMEQAEHSERLFIILDEMLKGTNSQDKLNGSLKFLKHLLKVPVSGIVATHDLALGDLAEQYPENFQNFCFEITSTADDIRYDYKLKPGLSRNMNASLLLRKMGLIE